MNTYRQKLSTIHGGASRPDSLQQVRYIEALAILLTRQGRQRGDETHLLEVSLAPGAILRDGHELDACG